jgi:rubrerythrin
MFAVLCALSGRAHNLRAVFASNSKRPCLRAIFEHQARTRLDVVAPLCRDATDVFHSGPDRLGAAPNRRQDGGDFMIEYLNEDEVYRVGICIEQAGLDFYTEMAEKADDPQTKRVFRRLARDEKEHLAFFESLDLRTAGGMGARPAGQDAELSKYVCSIVDGGIFKNIGRMEKVARRKFNSESALELALEVEKDAVLYYSEAYRANPKKSAKKALERLIDEEKSHVVEISRRLEALRKQKARGAKKTKKK